MPRLVVLALLLVLGTFGPLAAQVPAPPATTDEAELTGLVLDDQSGEPIIGATVRVLVGRDSATAVPGSSGAITDQEGRFRVSRLADSTVFIDVSSLGYESRRLAIARGIGMRIELAARSSLQQTVSVTAVRRTRSVEDACCRVESIREEVQQHAPFAPSAIDVLRRYSSCTSTRTTCALDNAGSIRLRGLEPTNVMLLVDGLPAMSGLGTMYGMGLIPSHALQTIRIAEGASSGLYGNGAVSGVVDLQLRVPTEEPELTVTGSLTGDGLAMPGERDLSASWTGMAGDVGIAAFASVNNHRRPDGLVPGLYDRYSGLVKSNLMLGDATELTASVLGGTERREGEAAGDGRRERTDHARIDASLRMAHSFSEEAELVASALASSARVEMTWPGGAFDATQRVLYAALHHNQTFGDHQMSLGAEVRDDRLTPTGADVGYTTTVASVLAQDELWLGDSWSVLASLRFDHHSEAGTIISPRGSIKFEPIANMSMRLMAGQGFKGQAHFDELGHRALHGGGRWRANDDLDFERSMTLNYDISYRFAVGDAAAVDANITAYHTSIEGKAVLQQDSLAAGTLYLVNSAEPARLRGMELQVRPSIGEHWSGTLGLAVIDYALRDGGEYRPLPLAPSLNLDLSVMYHDDASGLTAEVWSSHVGPQTLPGDVDDRSEPYTLINLRAEKSFGSFAVFAGLMNLLDEIQTTRPVVPDRGGYDASTITGPLEGREFFVGVRIGG